MTNKSRILILTTSYLPSIGGSELAIREITKRLPDIDFDIITSRSDSQGRFAHERATEEIIGNTHIYRVGNSFTLSHFFLCAGIKHSLVTIFYKSSLKQQSVRVR